MRNYFFAHVPIDFYFAQSKRDFIVEEIPLYPFSEEGEHRILKVRKKELTTWEMVDILATHLEIKRKDIGVAGLKDKHAMTIQYISINKKHDEKLENFTHSNIKILDRWLHSNKIRRGHLKGNRFMVRLKRVTSINEQKIRHAFKSIERFGMPNYFGYQRFGNSGENYLLGKEIIDGKREERSRTKREFLINAYQSYLFNAWLSSRIELSHLVDGAEQKKIEEIMGYSEDEIKALKAQPHKFKMLLGDIAMHYPYGKAFEVEELGVEANRFNERDISITGLLAGKRAKRANGRALEFEKPYDEETPANGERRYAWVFPTECEAVYKEEEAWLELHFTLPKGSYATVLIEELAKKDIK